MNLKQKPSIHPLDAMNLQPWPILLNQYVQSVQPFMYKEH